MSILCSIEDFIQSKQVEKAVLFHDLLKRPKLKIRDMFHVYLNRCFLINNRRVLLWSNSQNGNLKHNHNKAPHPLNDFKS